MYVSLTRSHITGRLKASGVEFTSSIDGLHYQVPLNPLSTSGEVILSTGSIGSPQLLLLSGIGPTQQLEEMNITTLLDSPFVGKEVQDNPGTTTIVESSKPLEFSFIEVVGIVHNSQLYIESGSFFQHTNSTNIQYLGIIASKVAFPLSRGELWLKSIDPQDSPYVRYNYFSHPYDLKECMNGVKVMINLSATSSFQEFAFINSGHSKILRFSGTPLPKNQLDDDALAKFCKDTLGTFWHFHGGCQVDLVVDKRHRVKGVDNLRVVDNSIFKDSPGTNPQATTMMLGRYMGIQILQEHMNILKTFQGPIENICTLTESPFLDNIIK